MSEKNRTKRKRVALLIYLLMAFLEYAFFTHYAPAERVGSFWWIAGLFAITGLISLMIAFEREETQET